MCWHYFSWIFIILLLYVEDNIPSTSIPIDLDRQLRILKDFYASCGILVDIDKRYVMIIKYSKISSPNFVYDIGNLEKVSL
jgi:hypothetical protein